MLRSLGLCLTLISTAAVAIETDQFLASAIPLKDSSEQINQYVRSHMQLAIDKANNGNAQNVECQHLAKNVFTEILGRFSISKISAYASTTPEIERYPNTEVEMDKYMDMSIYQDAKFPLNMVGLARTINVGGIYMGTDKLGHFSLLGKNYYTRYLKHIKHGMNPEKALRKTVVKGIHQEVSLLGYTLGGVLSFADLEANYQGLRFGIAMCEKANPYLQLVEGKWQQNPQRLFQITDFMNPKMDETYNPSFWRPNLYKKVIVRIKDAYCPLLSNPLYQARMEDYEQRVRPSYNDQVLKEFLGGKLKYDRSSQSLKTLCP